MLSNSLGLSTKRVEATNTNLVGSITKYSIPRFCPLGESTPKCSWHSSFRGPGQAGWAGGDCTVAVVDAMRPEPAAPRHRKKTLFGVPESAPGNPGIYPETRDYLGLSAFPGIAPVIPGFSVFHFEKSFYRTPNTFPPRAHCRPGHEEPSTGWTRGGAELDGPPCSSAAAVGPACFRVRDLRRRSAKSTGVLTPMRSDP